DLAHDLARLIEALGETVSAPLAEPEVLPAPAPAGVGASGTDAGLLVTLDELSKRLNVSTKTVRRWRKLGLVGRRALRNGKYQVYYQESVIHHFLTTHQDRVERGSKFSQMTDAEREDVLRRARRLSRACGSTL